MNLFELFVPALRGLKAEVLKFDLDDPRDVQIYHALIKAHTQPWKPETDIHHWLEDLVHDRGNYLNVCLRCRVYFKGHARRVVCRKCGKKPKT